MLASSPSSSRPERYRSTPGVRTCDLDGELVLLDLDRGEYYGLGELGTRAWTLLDGGVDVPTVAERLVPHYRVDVAQLVTDLRAFVSDLCAAGLLIPLNEPFGT